VSCKHEISATARQLADVCLLLLSPCSAQGWDKTYCLRFVEGEFDEIHFFGDKTFPVSSSSSTAECLHVSMSH
jgi:hypothetical protein